MPDPTQPAQRMTAEQRTLLAILTDHLEEEEFPGRVTLNAEDVRVLCELIDHQARELAALWAQVETIREQTLTEAIRIVQDEPELEGPMPTELALQSREDLARAAVRATKHNIHAQLAALRQPSRPPTE